MGFSLSGAAAGGAQDALARQLAEQLREQQQAEAERAQRAQEDAQRSRLAQDASQHADVMGLNTRAADQRDAARRDDNNRVGVEDMERQRQMMDADDARKQLAETLAALMGDETIPGNVKQSLRLKRVGASVDPKDLRTPDQIAGEDQAALTRKLTEAEALKKLDAKYRQPSGGDGFTLGEGQTRFGADGKPIATNPKAGGAAGGQSPYAAERATRTVSAVDDLIGQVNNWTAGPGSLMSSVPGTDARNFSAKLNTLKGNIAFNELAQMREASKTGGALGAVSERELALLESTLGALDAGQSPDQLKTQLQQVKESVQRFQAAAGGSGTPEPVASHGGGTVRRFNPATGKIEP